MRHALLRARALGASLVELLDNVRACVIQLDRRARPIAANDRARALLRRGDGLRDEDGRLRAALPREDAALQGLIARALPLLDGPGEGGSMPVSRPQSPSRLVLHVSPVHDAGVESGRGRVGALVLAVDPADRTGFDPERVGKALGLTPAESRVAVSLAQGKTIDDIAAETGRSRTTVKWHIRHIYAELGVSRPIELAQLVTSLADIPGVASTHHFAASGILDSRSPRPSRYRMGPRQDTKLCVSLAAFARCVETWRPPSRHHLKHRRTLVT